MCVTFSTVTAYTDSSISSALHPYLKRRLNITNAAGLFLILKYYVKL